MEVSRSIKLMKTGFLALLQWSYQESLVICESNLTCSKWEEFMNNLIYHQPHN